MWIWCGYQLFSGATTVRTAYVTQILSKSSHVQPRSVMPLE